ncbi:pyrimidine utilization protein C [Mesorhizobium sp. M7A.F.Ca.US.006.01.1.1]|uniref:RidA family protein n=1 Tax=Mesorhizobium sp. M7A.F.Ca.US.006.01.1.1 TaxID=2496707 RepID=UPI000FCA8956|nr:RidA family protein [Mesorhizobium sp. M7A.F.Ca.US.006.01.1.1]RUZ74411.1 pyrimidine utilization protein C [Mesorhizobium sp. M7A.F.Ca.US.006.01.1.1]
MFIPIIPEGSAKPIAPYVHGTRAGNTVYVSGMLSLDKNGAVLHPNDAAAQTQVVIEQIQAVLKKAGASLEDIAYNMIFISDMQYYSAMNEVYSSYFKSPPARFCIVSQLVKKDCVVEITSIAHL